VLTIGSKNVPALKTTTAQTARVGMSKGRHEAMAMCPRISYFFSSITVAKKCLSKGIFP
jgi:hypothetical protein